MMIKENEFDIIDKVEGICGRGPQKGDVFVDLMLDQGFKRVFGVNEGKELMIGLLRHLLPEKDIVDLTYIQNQSPSFGSDSKKSVYDVQCQLKDGSRIIVEVQRTKQDFFMDRILYYGTMPISSQIQSGGEYELLPVYVIAFVNFNMTHSSEWEPKIISTYKLIEDCGRDVMSDNLTFTFVELGRFNKSAEECGTFEEKLYFCFRHMHELKGRPVWFDGPYFEMLFAQSAVADMTGEEREQYYRAMTTERDIRNQIACARREGLQEGLSQGKAETAKILRDSGVELSIIVKSTGLTPEQIQAL